MYAIKSRLENLFDVKKIYAEDNSVKSTVGSHILENVFPEAELIYIKSHYNIPQLALESEMASKWLVTKKQTLVLGEKKGQYIRENGRSTDYIASSLANGCAASCQYCYVARRKGYSNPLTIFTNIDQCVSHTVIHAMKRGPKKKPNQCDPTMWTYDIGENNDCSIDDTICNNVKEYIDAFTNIPHGKVCFATKFYNENFLNYDPQGHTRIRMSLMPQWMSTKVDIRTDKISDRIVGAQRLFEAGYEVHFNFSPVIVVKQDNLPYWLDSYAELFEEINNTVSDDFKKQCKCEVIFLTHNVDLHNINLHWNPKGEELLWTPVIQEDKVSENGMVNIRYNRYYKSSMISMFKECLNRHIPWCDIRYIF